MELTSYLQDDILVIELSGEFMGGPDSEQFVQIIEETIRDEHPNIVVDMSRVTWMNSSGLGLLISALTSLRSSGGDLRLAGLSERLQRPLKITKLDTVFKRFDSLEDAVKSYQE